MKQPCKTCPWRKTTPRRGFPGGCVDAKSLLEMDSGEPLTRAMQCHSTGEPQACVGFAVRVGFRSFGLRLAASLGAFRMSDIDPASLPPLHTLKSLLRKHGSWRTAPCESVCENCRPDCRNLVSPE